MIRKYKIILVICFLILFCNIVAKIVLTKEQGRKISVLQQRISHARQDSHVKPMKNEPHQVKEQSQIKMILHKVPEELSFTHYAARIRSMIDSNDLIIEESLVFMPEKDKIPERLLVKYTTFIRVTGTYGKIKRLISDLRNMEGLSYFDSAKIIRGKKNPDKIKLDLQLSVFFKRGTA